MKQSNNIKHVNNVTTILKAFMQGMEQDDLRTVVASLQAALEYKEEELRIYRRKYKEETGKNHPDLTGGKHSQLCSESRRVDMNFITCFEII